ncbi:molybdate transport system substrate-binding protein [Paracoccus isoporae]|uniref:Molybdate-binding protein ModA n=2 Tax=Paracoccus isoporae TaxID=591205 RepID=A0A1G6WGD5_9RHOB|nr:molybdate ABC transporter substrate-binding protein [Paracoccus isoporae]SDD64868.1 molybdate transport system substrate-binding protein [Paracoccus isoporae]
MLAALGVVSLAGGAAGAEEITVFAAASLANAMTEIEAGFEAETGHDLTVSLAGSSALARQIQQGAPADIFISANPGWMDALQAEGLIEPGSRLDLLSNRLVLIAHGPDAARMESGADADLAARIGSQRLSMALVDAVPAGIYGKAALETLGLWDAVSGQVVQTDNVRAALALVASGEAGFGITYATDAVAEGKVSVIWQFPEDSHPPIVYPVADLAGRDLPAETDFMAYLRGQQARAAFEAQGFTVLVE